MSTLVTDDFAGTADPVGAPWTTITAEQSWKKTSGVALPNNVATDSGARNTAVAWPLSQWVEAKMTVTGTSNETGPGLGLRISSVARSYYRILVCKAGSNNVTVQKAIAGAFTTLSQSTVTWVDGDVLYAEVVGVAPGSIIIKRNGTAIGTPIAGDAALSSGDGGIAYSSSTTSASLDDFAGGEVDVIVSGVPGPRPTSRVALAQRMT